MDLLGEGEMGTSRVGLATPMDVSELTGIPVATLAQWRWRGTGPDYIKLGRHVRYSWPTIERWLESQTRSFAG